MPIIEEYMREAYLALAWDLINKIRESGMPISDLSKKSGVAIGSISAFLNRHITIRLDTAIALATATNCQLALVKNPSSQLEVMPTIDTVKIGYINKNGMEIIGHELQKDRSQRQYRACIMKCRNCAREKTVYPAGTCQSICRHCRQAALAQRTSHAP